jgi:all-trans-retinol 13,14-reductase
MSNDAYDAVVIGSGLGGLTAAALLAKAGRKVCLIERNHTVGGAASAFKKGALTIEPALHQTADPHNPGEPKHAIPKELGLLDEIEWIPITPFYSVKGGPIDEAFDLPVGFDAAYLALSERFPKSREGFARLLGAMEHMLRGVAELMEAREERSIGKLVHGLMESRGLIHDWRASTGAVLQRELGDDEGAKFAVATNLAYYATPSCVALLRVGAGRIPQDRRPVHQGWLTRIVDEARQVRHEAWWIGDARPRGEGY